MNILEYAQIINADLYIHYCYYSHNGFKAEFEHCEIQDGIGARGCYGVGSNPQKAVEQFVFNIRGKRIILNGLSKNRREFDVPYTLTGLPDICIK